MTLNLSNNFSSASLPVVTEDRIFKDNFLQKFNEFIGKISCHESFDCAWYVLRILGLRQSCLYNLRIKTKWLKLKYFCPFEKKGGRVWARPCHCANATLQLELSLYKTAKGTICPLQNLGKKLERKHTRRDLFRYRSCKLKQNVESIFYRTFKVHSKVTFQSRSTAIFVGNLRQGFWFFVRSRSREIHKNTKNTA